jgi:hypothetical protein
MFVPYVPPTASSHAAQELSQRITAVIQEYQKTHPGIAASEVRLALRISARQTTSDSYRRVLLVLMVATALLAVLGILAAQGPQPVSHGTPLTLPLVAAVVIFGLIFLIAARR